MDVFEQSLGSAGEPLVHLVYSWLCQLRPDWAWDASIDMLSTRATPVADIRGRVVAIRSAELATRLWKSDSWHAARLEPKRAPKAHETVEEHEEVELPDISAEAAVDEVLADLDLFPEVAETEEDSDVILAFDAASAEDWKRQGKKQTSREEMPRQRKGKQDQ